MIYFDNASTTPVSKTVVNEISSMYLDEYFNPSATYEGGRKVGKKIEEARENIAKTLACKKEEIYFTSCATESNNWVINNAFKNKKGNIIISCGEHACVYETAKNLESKGLDVRYAPLNEDGSVNEAELLKLVDDKTNLVSIIHVSNETGVINDIGKLAFLVKKKNPRALFHSDGVQAYLKTPINLRALGIDFYSISGHKVGAPKGIGLLYVNSKNKIAPYIYGGGQEKGMRSGTENVGGIIGLSEATKEFLSVYNKNSVENNYEYLINVLKNIPNVKIIGNTTNNTKLILCVSLSGVRAETVQSLMSDNGIYIGRGSACSSKHGGNRVLSAMKVANEDIDGAIRLSLSPKTQKEEIDEVVDTLKIITEKLRGHTIG